MPVQIQYQNDKERQTLLSQVIVQNMNMNLTAYLIGKASWDLLLEVKALIKMNQDHSNNLERVLIHKVFQCFNNSKKKVQEWVISLHKVYKLALKIKEDNQ